MSATRSRKEDKSHSKHMSIHKNADCEFCAIDKSYGQYVSETESFKIIRNIYPYSIWDDLDVLEHLMVVPKVHMDSLESLTPGQASEFIRLISSFENKGYNVYARGRNSNVRSIAHQHTHLIRTDGDPKSLLFLVRKPFYFRYPF